jgi:pyoverdine/dityrosine biosynthesis protein Dit1
LRRDAFCGYVEVVTIVADGSVFKDILRCGVVRDAIAHAYADAVALKDRLAIKEIAGDIKLE